MVMQKGRDLALKIGNGEMEEEFTLIAAAKAISLSINNNVIDISSLNSNGFQELQSNGGMQSTVIQMEGIFKDSASEEILREVAFKRHNRNYQFIFANGDSIKGAFVVNNYKRQGSYNGLETFSLQLLSSGEYAFTKGGE